MTTAELKEYLTAAANAENALYFCQNAQEELHQQITANGDLPMPSVPEQQKSSNFDVLRITFGAIIVGAYWVFYAGILIYFLVDGWVLNPLPMFERIVCSLFAPFITFLLALVPAAAFALLLLILSPLLGPLLARHERKKEDNAFRPYREKAEREIIAVTTTNASRTALRRQLTSESHKLSARAAAIQAILNNLYNQNVLHPRFRNMMAVNQLQEYLEMGVCTELEGPSGAYAQYLNDLRAEKICGSIQQLEETMRQGFSAMAAMMGRLSMQLQQTSSQLEGLESAVRSDLARIERGISTSSRELSAALSDVRSQAERIADNTGSMAITAKTAAWNDYVTSLENGVRGYMLRRPG